MRKRRAKRQRTARASGRQQVQIGSRLHSSTRRLSSRAAVRVSFGAAIAAVASLSTAALLALKGRPGVLLLLAAGAALSVIALFVSVVFPTVEREGDRYIISDLLRREVIPCDHVCMVVEARGAFTNLVRLHFRRRTLFGWTVSFVPCPTHGVAGSLVASLRSSVAQVCEPAAPQASQPQR
ncbi:MAG TPA: hypothetical protein VEH04_11910 [Verrucomicrobiae bacterium]|nr:hypothetical protein [Verrucomicrobiae bacterium]